MKLKYVFECMELDDRIVAIPVGDSAQKFRGVIRLNDSASEILALLKQDTTEESVVAILKQRYGDEPEICDYVHDFIAFLSKEGVLE